MSGTIASGSIKIFHDLARIIANIIRSEHIENTLLYFTIFHDMLVFTHEGAFAINSRF